MKQKTFIIIAFCIVFATIIFINKDVFAAMIKGQSLPGGPAGSVPGGPVNAGSPGAIASTLDVNKLLKKGVQGEEVKQLQYYLNQVQPTGPLVEDGVFGSLTEAKLYSVAHVKSITLAGAHNLLKSALGGN